MGFITLNSFDAMFLPSYWLAVLTYDRRTHCLYTKIPKLSTPHVADVAKTYSYYCFLISIICHRSLFTHFVSDSIPP